MNPHHELDPQIEAIVRKRQDMTQDEEPTSACPFCGSQIPESCVDCPNCMAVIPYCIATGRHIVLSDLTVCPSCEFPASFSAFTKLMEAEGACPMCSLPVDLASIRKLDADEAREWLKKEAARLYPEKK